MRNIKVSLIAWIEGGFTQSAGLIYEMLKRRIGSQRPLLDRGQSVDVEFGDLSLRYWMRFLFFFLFFSSLFYPLLLILFSFKS